LLSLGKTLERQDIDYDYEVMIENSIGIPFSPPNAKKTPKEGGHGVDGKARVKGVVSYQNEAGKHEHNVEVENQRTKLASTKFATSTTSRYTSTPTVQKAKPTSTSRTNFQKAKNPKEHITLRVEDLDENSTLEDLLKDWSKEEDESKTPKKNKKPPGTNSPLALILIHL